MTLPSRARSEGRMFGVPGSKKLLRHAPGDVGIAHLKRPEQRLHDLQSKRKQSQAALSGIPTCDAGQSLRNVSGSAAAEVSNGGRDRDRTCDPYHVKEAHGIEAEENQCPCTPLCGNDGKMFRRCSAALVAGDQRALRRRTQRGGAGRTDEAIIAKKSMKNAKAQGHQGGRFTANARRAATTNSVTHSLRTVFVSERLAA